MADITCPCPRRARRSSLAGIKVMASPTTVGRKRRGVTPSPIAGMILLSMPDDAVRRDARRRHAAVGVMAVVLSLACKPWLPPPPGPPLGSATDGDGNVYATVVIGHREWMATNLKTTHYNDGTPIPLTEDANGWADTISP